MAAGDFNRSTAIVASQRSVTDHLHRSATLLPAQRQYSAVFAGHQRLSDQIEFEFDGPYSRRRSEEHTSELQSLMRISYAVFCLKTKRTTWTSRRPDFDLHSNLPNFTPDIRPYKLPQQ